MTDVPLFSTAGSYPESRPTQRDDSRPDLCLSLLEAIHRRDGAQAKRLSERWVHRRGLVSLESFLRNTLSKAEGPEACRWLQEQLNLEPPPARGEGTAAALGPEIRLHDCIRSDGSGLPFAAAPPEPLPSVEEVFAALAAEFSVPSITARPAPEPVGSSPQEASGLDNQGFSGPEPNRRFSFGRVRSLVRDCLEEAIGTLRVPAAAPPEEFLLEMEHQEMEPQEMALPLEGPREEALAPPPAFHPNESILASQPAPPIAKPGLPRWLPRLGPPAPSRRPAPAPADLADLRAWLPDDSDLPRAC